MITITCSQPGYAIKLFQVLNTRGLNLSPADLIKSHLYGKLEDEIKRRQFISTWQEIEIISKQMEESITDLLTYYEYHLLGQNPRGSLYEELTKQFNGQDPNKNIYEFKEFVDFFNEITRLESKLIFSFWYLPNQVFWKAILTTAKRKGFSEFEGLCKELRKMYYSYWIAGYSISRIKQLSFKIIGWVKENRKLIDIISEIEKKMKDDNIIPRVMDSLRNDVYGESWLRPLLVLVEYAQTDDAKISYIELDSKLHVDHILPLGWKSVPEWNKTWTEKQAEKWLNKIGNLTLLSKRKNVAQRNDPPFKKKQMYEKGYGGKTAFIISQKVIDALGNSGWTEKDVQERQEWIIKEIESIFEVKLN